MKKIIFSIFTIIIMVMFSTAALATENEWMADDANVAVTSGEEALVEKTPENSEEVKTETKEDKDLSDASETILGAVTEKDKKIAELSDKYNDKTLGTVAYYLERVRYYSTPIFFILLTIGGFNFFIIGNKKLDKKEQGYGWITACIIGWVAFQCIPLIFALFAL